MKKCRHVGLKVLLTTLFMCIIIIPSYAQIEITNKSITFPNNAECWSIQFSEVGTEAYASLRTNSVVTINVEDLSNPQIKEGRAWSVGDGEEMNFRQPGMSALIGNYLFIAWRETSNEKRGIRILDVSDSTNIRAVGYMNCYSDYNNATARADCFQLVADNGKLFVLDGGGVRVYDINAIADALSDAVGEVNCDTVVPEMIISTGNSIFKDGGVNVPCIVTTHRGFRSIAVSDKYICLAPSDSSSGTGVSKDIIIIDRPNKSIYGSINYTNNTDVIRAADNSYYFSIESCSVDGDILVMGNKASGNQDMQKLYGSLIVLDISKLNDTGVSNRDKLSVFETKVPTAAETDTIKTLVPQCVYVKDGIAYWGGYVYGGISPTYVNLNVTAVSDIKNITELQASSFSIANPMSIQKRGDYIYIGSRSGSYFTAAKLEGVAVTSPKANSVIRTLPFTVSGVYFGNPSDIKLNIGGNDYTGITADPVNSSWTASVASLNEGINSLRVILGENPRTQTTYNIDIGTRLEFGSISYEYNSAEITEPCIGEIKSNVKMGNYSGSEKTVVVVNCLYEISNNRLILKDIATEQVTVLNDPTGEQTFKLPLTISAGTDLQKCAVKTFVWDSYAKPSLFGEGEIRGE